ncbi:COA1 [Branchiostoma lanceolatum]|uniref:COA1 protein n=1 Tax=Branchiostoma lanceolatum TaxID=7740 RepID=A0A8J9YPP0_BRALA|nr:COA1 [Branchiostoma lanceolatum]
MVSTELLKRIALYGGALALGGAFLMRNRIQNSLAAGEYYKKSMEALSQDPTAMAALGAPPLKTRHLDLGDTEVNNVQPHLGYARLDIPVVGGREKGTLRTNCTRDAATGVWTVEKLELFLENTGQTVTIVPPSSERR